MTNAIVPQARAKITLAEANHVHMMSHGQLGSKDASRVVSRKAKHDILKLWTSLLQLEAGMRYIAWNRCRQCAFDGSIFRGLNAPIQSRHLAKEGRIADAKMSENPIRRVAVVGAGPAGAIVIDALAQEKAFDLIRVFERRHEAGGCW